jgi:hypothetical protein
LISDRRLREKQKAMRARRRGVRPWDHVQEDDAERFIFRMRNMFEAGMSSAHIANALNLSPALVEVLRNKRPTQG